MSEDKMIRHCSPTLRGIKTGSIFSAEYESREAFEQDVIRANKMFRNTRIRFCALKYINGKGTIYVYRPDRLMKDIQRPDCKSILSSNGYECSNFGKCLKRLIDRLDNSDEFPHEIGLFLGYPPEDVKGFIENDAKGCKYVDHWKVYGDVDRAKALFKAYRRSTKLCYSEWGAGVPITALVN